MSKESSTKIVDLMSQDEGFVQGDVTHVTFKACTVGIFSSLHLIIIAYFSLLEKSTRRNKEEFHSLPKNF